MKIFIDESGQSGCVLQKADLLNFQKQPTFAIGAVVVRDENAEQKIVSKYMEFKSKYDIQGEIKGNELLTRSRNEELNYVLKEILDRYHYYVLLYDKRFYISTLLLLALLGPEYQYTIPVHFYQQATMLSQQNDDFFVAYLKYIEHPNSTSFSEYLHFLIRYNYMNFEGSENAVVEMARRIVESGIEDKCYDDFMTFGWYDNPKIANLINLNALAELVFFIKSELNVSNNNVVYIHDHILEFEDTIIAELKGFGINIEFADSTKEPMLQVADNAVSILRHAYDKAIGHIRDKQMWEEESEWQLKLLSRVIRKISISHINFTLPVCDWAAAITVVTMFTPRYPKKYRNNFHFNYHYQDNLMRIFSSLSVEDRTLDDISLLLES